LFGCCRHGESRRDNVRTLLSRFVGVPFIRNLTTEAATATSWKSSKMSDCRN
jgi:hypothetical protein